MPTTISVAPAATIARACTSARDRAAASGPVCTWPTISNVAGSRPSASSARRIASRRSAKYSTLPASVPVSSQPAARRAASAIPRGFCPPRKIGGPPGVSGAGALTAPASG